MWQETQSEQWESILVFVVGVQAKVAFTTRVNKGQYWTASWYMELILTRETMLESLHC